MRIPEPSPTMLHARFRAHPLPLRMTAALLVLLQAVLPSLPQIMAQSAGPAVAPITRPGLQLAPSPIPPPVLTPENVPVNRTVPLVEPPQQVPTFSSEPTDAEFLRARVFSEPLVPINGTATAEENQALAQVLTNYFQRENPEDTTPLEQFLSARPQSPWRAALLSNLGSAYYKSARFTKAFAAWEEAWQLSREDQSEHGRAIADGIAANLARLYIAFGRMDSIRGLLGDVDARGDVRGSAAQFITLAREGLWQMENEPQHTFKCGPFALVKLRQVNGEPNVVHQEILNEPSTERGTSLAQVAALAQRIGMKYQVARRQPGGQVLLPCVVHWKAGHFSALTREEEGKYLVDDSIFGGPLWVSEATLNSEASGLFLVPEGPLPGRWQIATETESQAAWGQSSPNYGDPDLTNPCNDVGNGGGYGGGGPDTKPCGMPQYTILKLATSLNVADVPVGYTPPVGPEIDFRITYNQREASQPSVFTHSNLGKLWTHEWLSYLIIDNTTTSIKLVRPGGGAEVYGYDAGTQTYIVQLYSQTELIKHSTTNYTRRLPDGSAETFDVAVGTMPIYVYRTKLTDPKGNALTFTYDATNRLASVTDAIGQVTTLSYELPGDDLKITKVTDPFGRYASFEYNGSGQLTNITDVLGIASSFTYSTNDFINTMTTPYGTTSFSKTEVGSLRRVEVTDPLGGKERMDYAKYVIGTTVPTNQVPTGLNTLNAFMNVRNSFFWDKKAMAEHPGDYNWAQITHWTSTYGDWYVVAEVPESTKLPLENRVWFNYPGQPNSYTAGGSNKPTKVARVLDDGTTQLHEYAYNLYGRITNAIDALDRTTSYLYATNEVDLLEVRQHVGTNTETVARFAYGTNHLVLSAVDAAGQTNRFGYNAHGQLTAITNALSEVVTLAYNTNGYLTNLTGAMSGATTDYTYDSYGRVRTVTDSEGYAVTYDYNALDQVTKITYPDASYEQVIYNKLDAEWHRDRLGRWSRTYYNPLRKVTAMQDALGRLTQLDWCGCGALDGIVDPNGNRTSWIRDVQGRPEMKIYPDQTTVSYTYEKTTSRLRKVTDAREQATVYDYFKDNSLQQVSHTNAVVSTPTVTFNYDTNYNRITSMTDGTGTTSYGYHSVGSAGGGKLANVDGPLTNDVISYVYDELGRVKTRDINGVAVRLNYDALGRVTSSTNALGSFTNSYVNATHRLSSVLYPNGQTTSFSYQGNTNDQRLQTIWHKKSDTSTISKFDYTYDLEGQIQTWTQQADTNAPTVWNYGYDPANQLLDATLQSTGVGATILKQFVYRYDAGGNRRSEQINGGASQWTHNTSNQLLTQDGGGWVRFHGILGEPASVMVSGKVATVSTNNVFTADVQAVLGTNVVPVIATDYSGNKRTNNYQLVVTNSAVAKVFTHDLNGNLTRVASATTTNSYDWDAANRLTKIETLVGTNSTSSHFEYDGLSRRVRMVEKENGSTVSDKRLLWDQTEIVEERNSGGGTVNKRYFPQGVQDNGTSYFYTRDHLGSIRELTDTSQTLSARYDYDPYGKRTKVSGSGDADFGFTGHYYHSQSGLHLALYRAYSSEWGRWLSRDPLEESGPDGLNLYGYVRGNPVNYYDPYGEFANFAVGALIGAGLDLGLQLLQNGGNFSCVNWKSVGVSAALGAAGVGVVAKLQKGFNALPMVNSHFVPKAVFKGVTKAGNPKGVLPAWLDGPWNWSRIPWEKHVRVDEAARRFIPKNLKPELDGFIGKWFYRTPPSVMGGSGGAAAASVARGGSGGSGCD